MEPNAPEASRPLPKPAILWPATLLMLLLGLTLLATIARRKVGAGRLGGNLRRTRYGAGQSRQRRLSGAVAQASSTSVTKVAAGRPMQAPCA